MAGEEMVKRLYETSAVNNNDSETCSTNATIATISFRGVIPSEVECDSEDEDTQWQGNGVEGVGEEEVGEVGCDNEGT